MRSALRIEKRQGVITRVIRSRQAWARVVLKLTRDIT